jgi:hypothetical protein
MNPESPPTDNKVIRWLKKNKLVAGLAGAAGLLFFVTKKGQSGSGNPVVYDEEGNPTDATAVQLVPVSASPSEGTYQEDSLREREERLEQEKQELRDRETERNDEDGTNNETPTEAPEAPPVAEALLPEEPAPAPVSTSSGSGITLHGRNFEAAIRVTSRRDGKDARGSYIEYVLEFPGFSQRWHYYVKDHKWSKVGDSREGAGANKPIGGDKPSRGDAGSGTPKPAKPPVAPPVAIAPSKPVAPPPNQAEKQKARTEIARLQGEIDGLQNHIAQLTSAIQQHPNAKQRNQWENERNADRSNIDHKRNEVTWWSART